MKEIAGIIENRHGWGPVQSGPLVAKLIAGWIDSWLSVRGIGFLGTFPIHLTILLVRFTWIA